MKLHEVMDAIRALPSDERAVVARAFCVICGDPLPPYPSWGMGGGSAMEEIRQDEWIARHGKNGGICAFHNAKTDADREAARARWLEARAAS